VLAFASMPTRTTSSPDRTPARRPPPPLRDVRRSQGLGLREVAARTGLDVSHLSRIERGRAGLTVDTLARLATTLKLRELERLLAPYVQEDE
jgi:transcriptional regulator with XRE-family HTH domain